MRRRRLLALAASGLATTAGCTGPEDATSDETDDSGTDPGKETTPTDPPDSTEKREVQSISVDSLQPGVIELTNPDSIGVVGESRGQYLFLDVTGGAENAPSPSELEFELDGTDYAPMEKTRRLWRSYNEESGKQYSADDGGWLLFELPATAEDPSSAGLRWPGGSWQPPTAIRERLASPNPSFDVSVEVPETVPLGEEPKLSVTFENTADVPGTFLLAVNRVGPYVAYAPEQAIRRLLDPGESTEWTGRPSFMQHEEISAGETTRLTFDWLGGENSREVEFVE